MIQKGRKYCTHEQWVCVGDKKKDIKVFLKSAYGEIPSSVQVFFDLTGNDTRIIPSNLIPFFEGLPITQIVPWQIDDGSHDSTIPRAIVRMIEAGLQVGWGCLGGHGRTGWLAAKVHQLLTGCSGNEAIAHIRQNYCEEAVETPAQILDLGGNLTSSPSTGRIFKDFDSTLGETSDSGTSNYLKFKLNSACVRSGPCEICENYIEVDYDPGCLMVHAKEKFKFFTTCMMEESCWDCKDHLKINGEGQIYCALKGCSGECGNCNSIDCRWAGDNDEDELDNLQ